MQKIAAALVKAQKAFGPAQIGALELLAERPHLLWTNVERSPDCWLWTAGVNEDGYGSIRVGPSSVLSHRAAHFLGVGALASALCVCHRCDNPRCCNPGHLFLSDHTGNMGDMRVKGRRKGVVVGEANGRARLTAAAVEAIRAQRERGSQLKELARVYGVGLSTISRVCRGENWQ